MSKKSKTKHFHDWLVDVNLDACVVLATCKCGKVLASALEIEYELNQGQYWKKTALKVTKKNNQEITMKTMKTSIRHDLWKSFWTAVQIMIVFLVFGTGMVFVDSLTVPWQKEVGLLVWIFSGIWLLVFAIRRYLS